MAKVGGESCGRLVAGLVTLLAEGICSEQKDVVLAAVGGGDHDFGAGRVL